MYPDHVRLSMPTIKSQQGSMLVIAIFIIVVFGLLLSALANILNSSQQSVSYEVLGVSRDAPLADINRAYKRLMLKYHPDRLKAQNLSPELVKVYEEKAKDIQAAYDLIKRSKRED